jgi:rare lipoprotein A
VLLVGVIAAAFASGCASSRTPSATAPPVADSWRERGGASWYGEPYHGRPTASGEIYDMHAFTAAHRTLAFGTWVRVTRRDDGRSVDVRVNDRGPFVSGRVIDLSWAAARRIGLDVDGVTEVTVEAVDRPRTPDRASSAPTLQPPAAAAECWWVQIGAFGDRDNAERARDRLRDGGFDVVVMEGPGGLHRVRVGPFADGRDADRALAELLALYPPSKKVECGG